jgi:hypothetical protein
VARYVLRGRKFIKDRILHVDDTPHAIALGAGIAMFITFLPLIGIQTILSVAVAALFRANKAVCVPIVWITNPFTAVPLYGACLALGRTLVPSAATPGAEEQLVRLTDIEVSLFSLTFWRHLLASLVNLGIELWVGCTVVSAVFAVAAYFLTRWAVVAHRARRHERVQRRHHFRAQLRKTKVARQTEPA